jgi:hypothetical protein
MAIPAMVNNKKQDRREVVRRIGIQETPASAHGQAVCRLRNPSYGFGELNCPPPALCGYRDTGYLTQRRLASMCYL